MNILTRCLKQRKVERRFGILHCKRVLDKLYFVETLMESNLLYFHNTVILCLDMKFIGVNWLEKV